MRRAARGRRTRIKADRQCCGRYTRTLVQNHRSRRGSRTCAVHGSGKRHAAAAGIPDLNRGAGDRAITHVSRKHDVGRAHIEDGQIVQLPNRYHHQTGSRRREKILAVGRGNDLRCDLLGQAQTKLRRQAGRAQNLEDCHCLLALCRCRRNTTAPKSATGESTAATGRDDARRCGVLRIVWIEWIDRRLGAARRRVVERRVNRVSVHGECAATTQVRVQDIPGPAKDRQRLSVEQQWTGHESGPVG